MDILLTARGPIQKFEGSMYSIICTDKLVTITYIIHTYNMINQCVKLIS